MSTFLARLCRTSLDLLISNLRHKQWGRLYGACVFHGRLGPYLIFVMYLLQSNTMWIHRMCVCRSSDIAMNCLHFLSWSPIHFHGGTVESGMQSVTKEQCNRAEQKKQIHTAMNLAMAWFSCPMISKLWPKGQIWLQSVFVYSLNQKWLLCFLMVEKKIKRRIMCCGTRKFYEM